MKFIKYALEGKLFFPFLVFISILSSFLLMANFSSTTMPKVKQRHTIEMKNFLVPPAKPVSPQTKSQKTTSQENDSSAADVQSLKMLYLQELVAQIERVKRYPEYEKRFNKEDKVTVQLTLERSGRIKKLEIVRPSRFSGFNKEATAAVRRALPFRAFPEPLPEEEITILFHMVFRLS